SPSSPKEGYRGGSLTPTRSRSNSTSEGEVKKQEVILKPNTNTKSLGDLHLIHEIDETTAYTNTAYNKNKNSRKGSLFSIQSSLGGYPPNGRRLSLNKKPSKKFARKVPKNAEGATLLVGGCEEVHKPICAFLRLKDPITLEGMNEVNAPTRFVFLLIGPNSASSVYHEIARSMGTLFACPVFRETAYTAQTKVGIHHALDLFMNDATVLPSTGWDHTTRLEPPSHYTDKTWTQCLEGEDEIIEHTEDEHDRIRRTGRLFGGLVQDIKRKAPFYLSDFKDAIHFQTLASLVFAYFASLSATITFGGLMGTAIGNNMASFESLISAAFCGITYALLSGQPLTILGATGPVLVFETIVYGFCNDQGWYYLEFRLWVGLWTAIILLIVVMFDLSALVSYITRFTEESFSCLISLIFILEACQNMIYIQDKHPVHRNFHVLQLKPGEEGNFFFFQQNNSTCKCILGDSNTTDIDFVSRTLNITNASSTDIPFTMCDAFNGTLSDCQKATFSPDVFFFSFIVFISTFMIAFGLKIFKETRFFPVIVRKALADYAVPIAIATMTAIDIIVGIDTPKLNIPTEFRPTLPDRGWIIIPFSKNAWWTVLAALVPALLLSILVFMDQQITAVIVNNRRFKLKKGPGYHLDLLIISVQIAICSVIGTPYFVAATVRSISHVQSLGRESKEAAPGEKPKFLGTREQRVTACLAFGIIGVSVLFASVLQRVPMPVLYGVFLYMGVVSLGGVQLADRIFLLLMPQKHQPDHKYLRTVSTARVHLFTLIQLFCLTVLTVVKNIKSISIAFPLMILLLCFVRKALDWVFTKQELSDLDDLLPQVGKKDEFSDRHIFDIESHDIQDVTNKLTTNGDVNRNNVPAIVLNGQDGLQQRRPSKIQVEYKMTKPASGHDMTAL
ncbi:unnamed protein product, partial [Owenia fusiformis]